jgi:hypothetical protein
MSKEPKKQQFNTTDSSPDRATRPDPSKVKTITPTKPSQLPPPPFKK